MIKILMKYKVYIAIIVGLMIIEPAINSALNFWLQSLFNSASYGTDKILILRLLTIGFLLWMLKRLATYIMLIFRDRYICNMKLDIKHIMFKKLIMKNTSHIASTTSSGEYISMFTNDITLLEQRFFSQLIGLFSSLFSVLILGYSFVALNSKLAYTIIGFGVITMLIPAFFSKRLNSKNIIFTHKIAQFTQKLKEYIVAYPTIKNYSIETIIEKNFDYYNLKTESAKFDADCSLTLANSFGQLFAWFMQFIGVGLGLMLVIKGEIMIGTVIAAQGFAGDLALPIQNIIISINSIRSVKTVLKKLDNI